MTNLSFWLEYQLPEHASASLEPPPIRASEADAARPSSAFWMSLPQFVVVDVSGADAANFLSSQLTCDVAGLGQDAVIPGGYLSPQGRVLATFLLWAQDERLRLLVPQALAESFVLRLRRFVMRSKVTLALSPDVLLGFVERAASAPAVIDGLPTAPAAMKHSAAGTVTRIGLDGRRTLVLGVDAALVDRLATQPGWQRVPDQVWDWFELRSGFPWVTPETTDQYVAQMLDLDRIGAISFTKGCYPGQEIVARTHYRGSVKRRLAMLHCGGATPPAVGAELAQGDATAAVGQIFAAAGSFNAGWDVLAVMHTEALGADLRVGAVPMTPLISPAESGIGGA